MRHGPARSLASPPTPGYGETFEDGRRASHSANGTEFTRFAIAHNNRQQDGQDGWTDAEPDCFEVVAFGSLARNIASSLISGDRVTIVGRFQRNSWVDSEGNKRSRMEIVVDELGANMRYAEVTITKNAKASAA